MADRPDDVDAADPGGTGSSPEDDPLDELLARRLPGIERLAGDEPRRVFPRRRRPASRAAVGAGAARRTGFTIERYGETVTALAAGGDLHLLDRMRGGTFSPEAVLDLHGHTVASATVAVDAFLARHLAAGTNCLLIIHGRGRSPGGPVLKEAVIRHLLTGPRGRSISALATAPRGHGGPGALLVLLRRR